MMLLGYCIWWLGILQAADFLTWVLKKAVRKIKKEDTVWKKVRWGIAVVILALILALRNNIEIYTWLYHGRTGMTNYEKLEMIIVCLADIKFFRLFYSSYVYLRHKAEKDMTDEEKINFGLACGVDVVITLAIYALMKCGIMFALLFVAALLLVSVFATPIKLIIKR